jgi:hypothetical protein
MSTGRLGEGRGSMKAETQPCQLRKIRIGSLASQDNVVTATTAEDETYKCG